MEARKFNLISFASNKWDDPAFASYLSNEDTKDKAQRTARIMAFLDEKISGGEAVESQDSSIFAMKVDDGEQAVLSVLCAIDYDEKKVFLPNEKTDPHKMNAYRNILNKYRLQINPVLTFYKNGPNISSLLSGIMSKNPLVTANINDKEYSIWSIDEPEDIQSKLRGIEKIYIADGHHRFSMFQEMARSSSAKIMISLTDSKSISLKSCHRVINCPLNDSSLETFAQYCNISKANYSDLNDLKSILLITKRGQIYKIDFKPDILKKFPIHSVIDDILLKKSLRISRDMIPQDVAPLPGNVLPSEYKKIFEKYNNSTAIIFIPDISIVDFFDIVDGGDMMPATSTWFEPKIIDGFVSARF